MTNRFRAAAIAAAAVFAGSALAASAVPAHAAVAPVSAGAAGDLARLSPTAAYSAFVHFGDSTVASRKATLAAAGLRVVSDYDVVDAAFATGTAAGFQSVRRAAGVEYIESNKALELLDDTAGWATGYEVARRPVAGGPYRAPDNAVIDGSGVGIGIVDSGVDASHPDLANVAKNFRFSCSKILVFTETGECFPAPTDLGPGSNTDAGSGHGTFTAGLAGGDGTASGGTFTGAAPGATLYGFGVGAGLNVLDAVEGLHHVYLHYDEFTPRIKVLNNSWGNSAGSEYDPDGIVEQLTTALVTDKGVTMVFAANNDGGNGSADRTNSYCKNPTPGVICVANYDDFGTGSQEGDLDTTSSRGRIGQPHTFPDISAPGSLVTSTCARTSGALCNSLVLVSPALSWEPYYGMASGTSAAAPIVAGAVALLLQANPSLTPAQIEDALLDTARKFDVEPPTGYVADPQNPGSTTSFDKGAGLLDVTAALSAIGAGSDNSTAGLTQLAAGDGGDVTANGATDIVSATANPGAGGVTYSVTVRDASDQGAGLAPSVRINQNVRGVAYRTDVTITAAGATPRAAEAPDDPATAEATTASRSGNTITFFVPYAEIGDPAAGAAASNVYVASYLGLIQDVAPGPSTGLGLDFILRPAYSAYTAR